MHTLAAPTSALRRPLDTVTPRSLWQLSIRSSQKSARYSNHYVK